MRSAPLPPGYGTARPTAARERLPSQASSQAAQARIPFAAVGEQKDQDTSERRREPRCLVCAPVDVQPRSTAEHRAVLRDISVLGASFLTRVALTQGETVHLALQLGRDSATVAETDATVVRVERLDPERSDVWSHQIAVQFAEPLQGHEVEINALAERLVKAGLPW